MKTGITALKKPFLYLFFFVLPLGLFAQGGARTSVAIIPLLGEEQEIVEQFGEELIAGVDNLEEYRPTAISMKPEDLPPDVPEGGFPAFVPPMPSLTRGLPYALTGQTDWNDEYDGYVVQLFLWEMGDEIKLIWSDWTTAYDQEEFREIIPGTLGWMFSKINKEVPAPIVTVVSDASRVIYYAPTDPDKWLYAGFRVGGALQINGDAKSNYTDPPDPLHEGSHPQNFNIAAYLSVQPLITPLDKFGSQLEAALTIPTSPLSDNFPKTFMLMLYPVKFVYRNGTMFLSFLGGAYWNVPFGDDYQYFPNVPIGISAGMQFGNKANFGKRTGLGSLFFDVRWMMDMFDTIDKETQSLACRRHMISISAGWELGFITKKNN